jgi:hypothetical protein
LKARRFHEEVNAMKKVLILTFAVVCLAGSMTPVFAQGGSAKSGKKIWTKSEMTKGEIVSIDSVKNEIVIKEKATGTDKTLKVDPKEVAMLKVGETVKVRIKPGTDIAENVKEMASKKK